MKIVCPYCCNCLTIARAPGTREHPQGQNAFTCRTCPYQFVLDQPYYERTHMKQKQKDDILGEEQSDLPVNEGMSTMTRNIRFSMLTSESAWRLSQRGMRFQERLLLPIADKKRRRASNLFLQGRPPWYRTCAAADIVQCVECGKQWREY
jgi:DNA-directed RNA polymerase subunit M/transcription elongation factor TFIIS